MLKTCSRCNEPKDESEFGTRGKKRPNEVFPYCKECRAIVSCMRRREIKHETFMQYGGCKCSCICGCNETEEDFLGLDHINDDGGKQRKELKIPGGINYYRWLKKHNWPDKDKLIVACHNCNLGRAMNSGLCPRAFHKIHPQSK